MSKEADGKPSLEERLQTLSLRRLEMEDMDRLGVRPGVHDVSDLVWRDHGDPAAVERIWGRLQGSLRVATRRERKRPFVAAVAAAALFGFGVLTGRVGWEAPEQVAELAPEQVMKPEFHMPEEPAAAREVGRRPSAAPATGTRRSSPRTLSRHTALRRNAPAQTGPATQALPEEPSRDELERPASVAPVVEVPRWLLLADRGEYAAAFQAVDEAGGFDGVLNSSSAEELMTLADVARAAGQQGRAIQALRRVVQLYPGDPNAPVAAMMLGNLLHRAGDVAGAAEAYALNRSLSPQGDFAEDALARQFEVALEAEDLERARALATQYEREFPEGRRLGEIREQLTRFERDSAAAEHRDAPREPARDHAPREGSEGSEGAPRVDGPSLGD